MVTHVTAPTAALLDELPPGVTLCRAPNPGPMTLDGTNTWVLGNVIIDPGPADEGHLAAVAGAAAETTAILLTHGHPDHVEGAARLSELLGGVPVRAADPAHCARGGEPFTGGEDLGGVTVLAVPGHTADSVAFRTDAAIFTGDTILGRGTTVVAWPDGDLGDYLASLTKLERLGPVPVLPGHGPALADCAAAARYYREHRVARLEQVRAAHAAGAQDAADVVRVVYADVDPVLWPAAEMSVRAQLKYLASEP